MTSEERTECLGQSQVLRITAVGSAQELGAVQPRGRLQGLGGRKGNGIKRCQRYHMGRKLKYVTVKATG